MPLESGAMRWEAAPETGTFIEKALLIRYGEKRTIS
jgi:hypothetical protein